MLLCPETGSLSTDQPASLQRDIQFKIHLEYSGHPENFENLQNAILGKSKVYVLRFGRATNPWVSLHSYCGNMALIRKPVCMSSD